MSVYPDESNPIKTMNEKETRRLSVASAAHKAAAQAISKEASKQIVFRDKTRFLIVLVCTLCLTLLIANSLALNFTGKWKFYGDKIMVFYLGKTSSLHYIY